jgi:integrase
MSRKQKQYPTVKLGKGFSFRFHRGTYRLRVYDRTMTPKEKTISLNTDQFSLANIRANDYFQRYVANQWDPWDGSKAYSSLSDALAVFRAERGDLREKTLHDYTKVVEYLISSVGGDIGLESIKPSDIRKIVHSPKLTLSSRLAYFRRLSAFFNWCIKQRLTENNPVKGVETPATPRILPNGLNKLELERLLLVAENYPWAREAFELLAWTGLRPGEAARLEWSDIDENVIKVVGIVKTNREHAVTIIPQARLVLGKLTNRKGHLLLGEKGGSLNVEYLSKVFRKCADIAKLPSRYTLYSLRHTFAAEYRRRGGTLYGLQYELGHTSIQTTQRYGHLGPDERRLYTVNLFTDNDDVVVSSGTPSGTSTSIVAKRSATQTQKRRSRLRKRRFDMEPMGGLEPPTCSLRMSCSTS